MLDPSRTWTLEQNDRRRLFAAGPRATLFAESEAFTVGRHRHPAWKVVLPATGHAILTQDGHPPLTAPGLLVPPQLTHACTTTSAYAALFIDPWSLTGAGRGPVRLELPAVRRLLAALGPLGQPDLTAAHTELLALTGRPVPILDARVAHALRELTRPAPLTELATEVGLSPPRLRTLVREQIGIPLARLRQWSRLREAIATFPGTTLATAAATADFTDQPHLTRTTHTMLGRTPGSLRHM
ncbi:helix-turn-helix domain-containing protein [Streptomyces boluensis]|uniref:Helix-turn-helix domain-containing protein n=1 Tax=Streptomyces boluensis TaxID=1775135 RepID=A0A964UVZ4_9ACTN|nr:helix-turn-helix domain-containing protein [Streptomyces boluensis]NBE56448.1 helix-turn-helix domain-containing protein [Streptomyces boluensis]